MLCSSFLNLFICWLINNSGKINQFQPSVALPQSLQSIREPKDFLLKLKRLSKRLSKRIQHYDLLFDERNGVPAIVEK